MWVDGNVFGEDAALTDSCSTGLAAWVGQGRLDATITDNDDFHTTDWAYDLAADSATPGGVASFAVRDNRMAENVLFTQVLGNTVRLADPDGLQVGEVLVATAGGIIGLWNTRPPGYGDDPPGALVFGAIEVIAESDVSLPSP